MYRFFFKRVLDFLLALIGLVVLLPFFLILVLLIKLDSKGPIFFKQSRIGKKKKPFNILKFRTMRINAPKDTPTHLLENPDKHITRIGRFLRKTSLDELPQLINILFGQMSVVGPRPALWNQYDLIDLRDKYKANDLRPGLTGWAQVNGRDELPIEKKAMLDGVYAKKVGILFDFKILFLTAFKVFRSDGVLEGVSKESTSASEKETESISIVVEIEQDNIDIAQEQDGIEIITEQDAEIEQGSIDIAQEQDGIEIITEQDAEIEQGNQEKKNEVEKIDTEQKTSEATDAESK